MLYDLRRMHRSLSDTRLKPTMRSICAGLAVAWASKGYEGFQPQHNLVDEK